MININDKVLEFYETAYVNNDFKRIKLSDYKDRWVVLFFYPADFTFVCPMNWKPGSKTLMHGIKLVGKI